MIKIKQKKDRKIKNLLTKQIIRNNSGSCFYLNQQWDLQNQDKSEEQLLYEENHSQYLGGYKLYCELDIIEIERIHQKLQSNQIIKRVDFNAIFCCLHGQSIFSIFEGNLRLFQIICNQLKETNFSDREDYDEEMMSDPKLRGKNTNYVINK